MRAFFFTGGPSCSGLVTDPQPEPGDDAVLEGDGFPSVDGGDADPRVDIEESVTFGASQCLSRS